MPRQPFLPFFNKNRGGLFDISTQVLGSRPETELWIAKCQMAWPHADTEMAVLLAQLMGATESAAALAVYQTLRRATAQYKSISAAASVVITDPKNRELLEAILSVHEAVEKERNALTHGHFGTYSHLLDGVIWMNARTYVDMRTHLELINPQPGAKFIEKMYSNVFIYRAADLKKIFKNIQDVVNFWYNFSRYLRASDPEERDGRYARLCEQSRIAQELEILRREKTPPIPLGSQPPSQEPKS